MGTRARNPSQAANAASSQGLQREVTLKTGDSDCQHCEALERAWSMGGAQ